MRQKDATAQLMHELDRLQSDLTDSWLAESLPEEWNGLDYWAPVAHPSTRVTLRLDTDMVKWFRALGPGYQKRINLILRIYFLGLVGGRIKAYPADDTTPRLRMAALAEVNSAREEMAEVVKALNRIGRGKG